MPLNAEFQQRLSDFTKKYGSEKGEKLFYAWVNKNKLDETKPLKGQKYKEQRDSLVAGMEVKETEDSFIVKGIIATTHIDSVGDKITRSTLDKWAKEINEGNPRANKVSYHHDRDDPRVVGVGLKGSAKVIPMDKGQYGLYVESEINKTHDLFNNIKYETEHKMLDSHSIEFIASENPMFEQLAGTQVRVLDDNTDLYGWTLASRPINEHAVMLKEVMAMDTEDKEKHKKMMMSDEDMDEEDMSPEEMEKMKKKKKKMMDDKKSQKEGNTMDTESTTNVVAPTPSIAVKEAPQIDMKEVVSKLLDSVEFKEAVSNIKVENKAMLNPGKVVPIEVKEFKEALQNKEKYTVDEQFLRAGRAADVLGLTQRYLINKESGKSAESKAGALEFKQFATNGRKLEYKNLSITSNQNTDTDYLLSAAELSDVFDPVVYNALNEKTVFWSILAKDDYSQKGNNQVQFTLKTAVNTTATFYTDNSVITGTTTRQKYMTKFKKAQVGVAVDGDMIAAARGGPIGDVFALEVRDATETLMSVMNVQLFASTGAETASVPIGMQYITDSATNTTLYNVTRTAANKLGPDAAGDTYINGSSVNVTLAQLRQAIRQCVTDGSNKADLVFVLDPIQEDKIKLLFDDLARYNSPKETRFGFETQLFIDGVPVFVDKDCGNGDIYCVDMSAHRVAIWVPPTLEMLGKRSDSQEGFIKTYYAVYNRAPRRLVQIYSLATT